MKKILIQLDTDHHPSAFDAIAAYDADVDVVVSYGQVTDENLDDVVQGAIFPRGPDGLANTAFWVGGSNVRDGEAVFAAAQKLFFKPFGRLHPRLRFPHISLLVMGLVTAVASFLPLATVINALIALTLFTQFIAQIAALTILRRKQPGLARPYKQWLYPVPSILALAGWIYIFQASGWPAIRVAIGWTVLGIIAFGIWARTEHVWPFGPKEIKEEFLEREPEPQVLS